jgi:hypothetical protein
MLTATYNTAPNQWTATIDAALAAWSEYVVGSAEFNIGIQYVPGVTYLAAQSTGITSAGYAEDGRHVAITDAQANLQGFDTGNGFDLTLKINPGYQWSFGEDTVAGKYHALSVITHELGHTLFAERDFSLTPFEILMENEPELFAENGSHLADQSALLYPYMPLGTEKTITDLDVEIAGKAGLTTVGDDTVYIVGPQVDAGSGNDTAIWLGDFDGFNSDLINFEKLVVDEVSAKQGALYSLYEVGFDRAPDLEGFTYWSGQAMTTHAVAETFILSDEFADKYQSRAEFLTALYENALNRQPDAEGLQYWLNSADSEADLLVHFASLKTAPFDYSFSL